MDSKIVIRLICTSSIVIAMMCSHARLFAQELRLVNIQWINDLGQSIPPFVQADTDIVGGLDDDTTSPPFTNTTMREIDYGPMFGNVEVIDTIETLVTAGPILNPTTWSGNVNVPVDQSEFPIVIDGNVSTGFGFIPAFSGLWRSDGAVTLTFRAFPSEINPGESLSITVSGTAAMQNSNFTAAVSRFSVFKLDGTRVQVVAFGSSSNAVDLNTTFELKVNDTFRVVLDVKTLDTTRFAGASARIQDLRIEAKPVVPDASYIIVPIHGQIERADVLPGSFLSPPDWLGDIARIATNKADMINAQRALSDIPEIEVVTVPGNWASLTEPGFKQILASRLLYLLTEALNSPTFIKNAAFVSAFILENSGNGKTRRSSRKASREILAEIHDAIATQRQRHGQMHPIFVDLIGHSRGGSVSGTVQKLLVEECTGDPNIKISWTVIDGIDPTPFGENMLERPLARAGDLLQDLRLERAGASRVSNFYAMFGLFGEETGIWGSSLQLLISLRFGVQTDDWLIERGYPHGRERPKLTPSPMGLIPGSTHTSIVDILVSGFEGASIGKPASSTSIVASTYFGTVVQDPLIRIESQSTLLARSPLEISIPRADGPFTEDGTALSACEFLDAVTVLVNSEEFQSFIIPELQFLVDEFMVDSITNQFPVDQVWEVVSGNPTVTCDNTEINKPAFVLESDATMQQQLNADSLGIGKFHVRLEIAMMRADSVFVAILDGPNLATEDSFSITDAPGLMEPFILEYEIERRKGDGCVDCLDTITVAGHGVLLLEAAVIAAPICPSDLNDDGMVDTADLGMLLAQFGSMDPNTDINGDGVVDMADLGILLGTFGTGCN